MTAPLIAISAARQTIDSPFGPMAATQQVVSYANGVLAAGGRPAILPSTEEIPSGVLEGFAGLILTGGGDINPRLYGEEPVETVYGVSDIRDSFEIALYEDAVRLGLPILATCRGMQLINALRGGTLVQEVCAERSHWQEGACGDPWHEVEVEPGSDLARIVGTSTISVNSYHHQGIGKLGKGLRVVGRDHGVIEALEDVGANLVAVQWHPEHMFRAHPTQMALFEDLVKKASVVPDIRQTRQEQFS
jgi:putative glutamine amidotransferase